MQQTTKDLTVSAIDRQNILNNACAVLEIQKAIGFTGISFENRYVILKEQVAQFFNVTPRTITNYLERNKDELSKNGYEVVTGNRLKTLKKSIFDSPLRETLFPKLESVPVLGIFNFSAFLNIAMLISESEQAAALRSFILQIVIDIINQRIGGHTKYINQRDEDFLASWYSEENYRRNFTDALKQYVGAGPWKYPMFTDKIYVSIFKEKAKEYRNILRLTPRDKTRDTFYAEVLDLIAAYENGFADQLKKAYDEKGAPLSILETNALFIEFEQLGVLKPLVEKARLKMASRDYAFRDILHQRLSGYIAPVRAEDFERFIGEKSKQLAERLEEAGDVLERLKSR